MNTKELLKKVRRVEIKTSHVVDEVFSGQYHSAFRGRGMEFEEVRPYQIGDDVRTIDWNVSARTGSPHVKLYREERELTVLLLVDLSASEDFGSQTQLKRELIAEIGATLAFSAIKNNDKVGLVCFSDQIEKVVPARKGAKHVLRVIRELLYCEPVGRGTDLAAALAHVHRTIQRKCVLFVVSDFQTTGYEHALRVARQRHDVIPIVIGDSREYELPNVGLIELLDNETGRLVTVDTSSRRVREQHAEKMRVLAEHRERTFQRMNLDSIQVKTGQPFIEPLTRFFHVREVRR